MAKTVVRKNLKQFGVNGNSNNFGQFGSVNASSPLKTKSIETIQALSAWLEGWQAAVVDSNKAPFLEDMNGAFLVLVYELFYVLQEGIPEWDTNTTYFIGSVVRKVGSNEMYQSLTNDNLGNALPVSTDSINWQFIYPVRFSTLTGQIQTAQIADNAITVDKMGPESVGQEELRDSSVGTNEIIDLAINDTKIVGVSASKILDVLAIANGGTGTTHKLMSLVAYDGNGSAPRNVNHNLGASPDFIFVVGLVSAPWAFKSFSFPGNSCALSSGVTTSNGIQTFDATKAVIGNHNSVNQLGFTYVMVAVKVQG